MVKVKICGVRTPEAARAARNANADFVGLNFVSWSKRRTDPQTAKVLVSHLAPVTPVGIFFDQEEEEIRDIAGTVGLEWVQLHGSEPPDLCRALSSDFQVIKAVAVGKDFDPKSIAVYAPHVELFLFDAERAGSGHTFDWSMLARSAPAKPFFLAGGLEPENVSAAIAMVKPFGVDTASGVENEGAQDPERIAAFIAKARRT